MKHITEKWGGSPARHGGTPFGTLDGVFVRENPNLRWMMIWGYPNFGNPLHHGWFLLSTRRGHQASGWKISDQWRFFFFAEHHLQSDSIASLNCRRVVDLLPVLLETICVCSSGWSFELRSMAYNAYTLLDGPATNRADWWFRSILNICSPLGSSEPVYGSKKTCSNNKKTHKSRKIM